MPWYAVALIIWFALGIVAAVAMIGRPRDPLTPGMAITTLAVNAAAIWAVVALAAN